MAGLIHAGIAVCMLRWARWLPGSESIAKANPHADASDGDRTAPSVAFSWFSTVLERGPLVLALLIPIVTSLSLVRSDLSGRKIVAYDGGNLDWGKPVHDQYGRAARASTGCSRRW